MKERWSKLIENRTDIWIMGKEIIINGHIIGGKAELIDLRIRINKKKDEKGSKSRIVEQKSVVIKQTANKTK